jgi:TolB-like protein/Flp pilus assembly protein TadD
MPSASSSDVKFEIGHVLFIDIVGYSKLLINEQSEQMQKLREIVRGTEQFRSAEAEGKLLRLPTGDGGALVFRTTPEAPVLCALEISKELKSHPELRVRMGIHSGPVNEITDLNEQANIAGAGINVAQRVMDCGDAGHILISKHVAEDLEHYPRWRPFLQDLGGCEVKHGGRVHAVNFYSDEVGNAVIPEKFKTVAAAVPIARAAPRKYFVVAAFVIATVAIGGFLFWKQQNPKASAAVSAIPEKSIAVLPFVNMSADKNDEYLSDGISEELITALSKISGLQVKARTSSFAFKGKNEDIQKIGQLLHVSHLLEGSVAKAGNKLRITAQLIQTSDGNHLWSETYDREMQDIFAVRSDVAHQVVQALQVKLEVEATRALAQKSTENLKAFQYYMQGRQYIQRRTRQDLFTTIQYDEKALQEDPNYALAYAGLADAYEALGFRGYIAPNEGRRKAEQAAHKALALDENLAEAHAALGLAYTTFFPSNFSLGDRELRRAIELSPSLPLARQYLGFSLVHQGRVDESLAEFLKARELDPFSSIIARGLAAPYYLKRDYVRALELLRQANELGPAFSAPFEIGIYIQNRLFNEALAELEKAEQERKGDPLLIFSRGIVYAAQGKRAEALGIIKGLEEMSGANLSQAAYIANVYAALNEKDSALTWLERALATGSLGYFYKDEPVWDSIRSDPRFADLLRRMGIPQ